MVTDSPQLPLLDSKDRPGTKDNDAYRGVTLPAADREDLCQLNTAAEVRTWTLLKAEEYERLALVYRSMHNATVLGGTLPTELLSLIFAFATATDELRTEGRMALRLLRVCRHWREVALGCSEIWANALGNETFHMGEIGVNDADTDEDADEDDEDEGGFGNEDDDEKQASWEEKNGRCQEYEYFLFALKLSTPRKLRFRISSFPQHFMSVTLPEHASRISSMTIKITSEDVFEQLYYILKNGMPVLCDLACPLVAKGNRLWKTLIHSTYTSPIDSASLPRLRSVRTAALWFPALAVPSLRSIVLNLPCPNLRVFTALRSMLAMYPAIDRLVLNRVLPRDVQFPTHWPGPALPSVDELAVHDDPHLVCAAFKTRAIPGCKQLFVRTIGSFDTHFGVSDFLPVDPADLRALLATADRMDILYSGTTLEFSSGDARVVKMQLDDGPGFTADFVPLLRPFAAITLLRLVQCPRGLGRVYNGFFRALPKLTTLHVSGGAANQFLTALSVADSDAEPRSVVSPSLARLDIAFENRLVLAALQGHRRPTQAEWVAEIMDDFSLLLKVLELRSARGARLQHLGWSERLGDISDGRLGIDVWDQGLAPLRELPGLSPEATAPLEALVDGTVNFGTICSVYRM